jgi:hypothetical protein
MSIDDVTPKEWDQVYKKMQESMPTSDSRHYDNRPYPAKADPVNSPTHYTHGDGIECIDAIDSMLGHELSLAYYQASVLKYLWRWKYKGGVESLRKARFFLERMIKKECEQGG